MLASCRSRQSERERLMYFQLSVRKRLRWKKQAPRTRISTLRRTPEQNASNAPDFFNGEQLQPTQRIAGILGWLPSGVQRKIAPRVKSEVHNTAEVSGST